MQQIQFVASTYQQREVAVKSTPGLGKAKATEKSLTLGPIRGLSTRPGRPVITPKDTSRYYTNVKPYSNRHCAKGLTSRLWCCFWTEAQNCRINKKFKTNKKKSEKITIIFLYQIKC